MNCNPILYLKRIRFLTIIVIAGLILSGVTAFPLLAELEWMISMVLETGASRNPEDYEGLIFWLLRVREGLEVTYRNYTFIAYGTDWLAFGHIVIALFFILPFRNPVRYVGVFKVGIAACVLVVPLALICGAIREIPFYWRLIDCSFGIVCLFPLLAATRYVNMLDVSTKDGGGSLLS